MIAEVQELPRTTIKCSVQCVYVKYSALKYDAVNKNQSQHTCHATCAGEIEEVHVKLWSKSVIVERKRPRTAGMGTM